MTHQDELKQLAGEAAVQFIEDGMVVGLGTGSTMKFMVNALGDGLKKNTFQLLGCRLLNAPKNKPTAWVSKLKQSMKLITLI